MGTFFYEKLSLGDDEGGFQLFLYEASSPVGGPSIQLGNAFSCPLYV